MGVISKAKPDIDRFGSTLRPVKLNALPLAEPEEKQPLQRLREVRLQKQLSVGQMAMLLGVSPSRIWSEEEPAADVSLSTAIRWAAALEVPVHELLVEQNSNMALVGVTTTQLSRITSTAAAMSRSGDDDPTATNMISRLVTQLEQLQESRE